MRRRDSIPAFKAERWGADKSPVWLSHSMAFCGVWVWETSEPTCLGPFSTAQICQSMPLREDVRALQDCVCKLNLSWLLSSSSCRISANAAEIGHMQKRPTTTVDFHVGGGVGHQLWWGTAVRPNLSPQPVLSFASCPALFYGFICSKLIPRVGLRMCLNNYHKASMWNQTWKSAFLAGRSQPELKWRKDQLVQLYVLKLDKGTESFILRFLPWVLR